MHRPSFPGRPGSRRALLRRGGLPARHKGHRRRLGRCGHARGAFAARAPQTLSPCHRPRGLHPNPPAKSPDIQSPVRQRFYSEPCVVISPTGSPGISSAAERPSHLFFSPPADTAPPLRPRPASPVLHSGRARVEPRQIGESATSQGRRLAAGDAQTSRDLRKGCSKEKRSLQHGFL